MAGNVFKHVASCFQVMWLVVFAPNAGALDANDVRAGPQDLDVNYVAEMLDKLQVFIKKQSYVTHEHFNSELKRLRGTMATLGDSPDSKILQRAVQSTEMERMEAEAAALEAMQYYHTVRAASGSTGGAPSCDFLTCGHHAVCKSEQDRAFCECVPCFSGDGFTCRPSKCLAETVYSPQLVAPYSASGTKPDPMMARDLSLSLIGRNGLVVAVRDEQRGNSGFLSIGRMKSNEILWGDWQLFSGESHSAFDVTLVGMGERLLIAYRDSEKTGAGYLVSGQLDSTDLTGFKVQIGQPYLLHKSLQQRVALVALSASRAVCLHATAEKKAGHAYLVQAHAGGISLLGKYHFGGEAPISHMATTKLSEDSFVVAYRQQPPDSREIGLTSKELSATWMGISDDDFLIVSPHQFTLEPDRPDMHHRDVALVSQNLFAYSYYSGSERKTKMSLVHVDPVSHLMKAVGDPVVLSTGYNSLVGAVSLPAGPATPSTFTYLQPAGAKSIAKVCGVSSEGRISACKDVSWAEAEVETATSIKLPDGRLLFAFQKEGTVQTRFLSAEEASAQDINMAVV